MFIPLNNGEIYKHRFKNINEYLVIKIGLEVHRVRDIYFEKFTNDQETRKLISRKIKKAVRRYGKDLLGGDIERVLFKV